MSKTISEKNISSNYDLYKVFYYVSKFKSLTKAAAELNVSQPAVSQSMKQLESNLGVKLTARTGHGIKLTPEGELIYPYIKKGCEAFALVDKALGTETKEKEVQDCFVTGTQYLHFANQKLPYRLLEHLPIILPISEDSVRSNLDRYLKTIGVKIYPVKEYDSYNDILNGVIHNEGIACLPLPVVESDLKKGTVFKLDFESTIPLRMVK